MNKDYRLLIVVLLLMMVVQVAASEAATRQVCRSGCTYSSIQAAIDAAGKGDTVLVRKGTYYENIDFAGKAITVKAKGGPKKTIINGKQLGSVVTFGPDEGAESVLDGFTLTQGSGYDLWKNGNTYGGGIYCYKSAPTIKNCTIADNTVTQGGGGIYCRSASPAILHSIIRHNTANYHGGGIGCDNSTPTISNTTVTDNRATWGGAIACSESSSSSPIIENCNIDGNMSGGGGGTGDSGILR